MYGKEVSRHEQKMEEMLFQESLASPIDYLADFPEEEEEEVLPKVSLTPPKDFLADFPEEEEVMEESSEFYFEEEDLKQFREFALKKFSYYAYIEEAYDYTNPEALDVLLESLKNIFYDPEVQGLFKWLVNEQIEAFWETFYAKVDNLRNQWYINTQSDEKTKLSISF